MSINELLEAAAAAWCVPAEKIGFEVTRRRVAVRLSFERDPVAERQVDPALPPAALLNAEPALAGLIREKALSRITGWMQNAAKLRGQADAVEADAVALAALLERAAPQHFDGVMGEALFDMKKPPAAREGWTEVAVRVAPGGDPAEIANAMERVTPKDGAP